MTFIIGILCGLVVTEALLSPSIFNKYLAEDFSTRVIISIIMLFPLGFVMGLPFPLGLRRITETSSSTHEQRLITAWAWGMNGYTTVIGSASTVFIAVYFGFKAALFAGLLVYIIGLLAVRKI